MGPEQVSRSGNFIIYVCFIPEGPLSGRVAQRLAGRRELRLWPLHCPPRGYPTPSLLLGQEGRQTRQESWSLQWRLREKNTFSSLPFCQEDPCGHLLCLLKYISMQRLWAELLSSGKDLEAPVEDGFVEKHESSGFASPAATAFQLVQSDNGVCVRVCVHVCVQSFRDWSGAAGWVLVFSGMLGGWEDGVVYAPAWSPGFLFGHLAPTPVLVTIDLCLRNVPGAEMAGHIEKHVAGALAVSLTLEGGCFHLRSS
jgi:hypothetical protein